MPPSNSWSLGSRSTLGGSRASGLASRGDQRLPRQFHEEKIDVSEVAILPYHEGGEGVWGVPNSICLAVPTRKESGTINETLGVTPLLL